jgi:hypothetical protein
MLRKAVCSVLAPRLRPLGWEIRPRARALEPQFTAQLAATQQIPAHVAVVYATSKALPIGKAPQEDSHQWQHPLAWGFAASAILASSSSQADGIPEEELEDVSVVFFRS